MPLYHLSPVMVLRVVSEENFLKNRATEDGYSMDINIKVTDIGRAKEKISMFA